MRHLTYVFVLVACLCGALWVEPLLHVNVLRRWRRLAVTILVVVVIFGGWDVAAIAAGHWSYDPARILGLRLPGRLPLEELLFFIVVPIAAILGFEAVRSVRGARSPAGDEEPDVETTNGERSPGGEDAAAEQTRGQRSRTAGSGP
jgi:lycopene cyclase domain-containing protein